MDPLERLLAAAERLSTDLVTAVASHCDLHDGCRSDPGGGPASGHEVPGAFVVATGTACRRAATGIVGTVAVGVPATTYPTPMADPCLAMAITPGALPPAPAVPVAHPSLVPAGTDVVEVSIDPDLPAGLYLGQLTDQAATLRRPFAVYLAGLP